jgi:hypothetical protein
MGRSFGARVRTVLPYLGLFVAAAGIATYLIRPFRVGQIGFDAAASVLYFDRIVAGRHLESFISATPKPLFTVLYGVARGVTGDWRVISGLAIGIYALAVVLATLLAARVAGRVAGGFAAVAFVGSVTLLGDASLAYSVGWALVGWLVAGLAVSGSRPRYGVAGVSLLIATLARFETLILLGLVAAVLVASRVAGPTRWSNAPPRGAWLLLIGFGALPVYMLHDWLLTANPFYTESVPVIASGGSTPLFGPSGALRMIVSHYGPMVPLLLLALVGLVALVHQRRWSILLGLVALGPGIVAFIVFLAIRHIYISARYFAPADLSVLFGAALGVASLAVPALSGYRLAGSAWRMAPVPVIAGGLVALALASFGPLDARLRGEVRSNLELYENLAIAEPTIAQAISAMPDPSAAVVLVPVLLRPQAAVDLGLSLPRVGQTSGRRPGAADYLRPGEIVYHDPRNDRPAGGKSILEVDEPTIVGEVRLDPVLVDHARRFWILRVTAP